MRILQVIESSSGGSARNLIDLSLGLLRRGHQVDVAYARPRIDGRFEAGLRKIEALGGRSFEVDIPQSVGPGDFKAALTLRKLIKQQGPYDILHLQSSKAGAVGRLARIGKKQKVVYTPHLLRTASPGLGAAGMLIFGTAERVLDRLSHATIYVSDFERIHAVEQRLPTHKMHVINNGIPIEPGGDRTSLRESLGLTEEDVVFGFVGRFAPQKDPALLVQAFKDYGGQAHLVMIGDGPLLEDCKALAGSNVHFLGQADGPMWMPAFDVFVLASASESFAYTLLEAAGAGLPIIATATGSSPEFVQDGVTGLVIPVGDREALVEAIRKLADDKELRQRMGTAGLARMVDFSDDAMVEQTLAVYAKVLNGHSG